MSHRSFSDLEYSAKRKQTRRDRFLGDRCDHALGGAGGGDRGALPEGEAGSSADWSVTDAADVRGPAALQPVG